MNKLSYEKPKMKKIVLRNDSAIAANCWSTAANTPGKDWYYDYNKGELGYLKFEMDTNCSGNGTILNVEYLPKSVGKTDEAMNAERFLNDNLNTTVKEEFTSMITDDPTKVS